MTQSPQKKALAKYRERLAQRGMARFEVLGREDDRELIRALAKRLAEDDAEASEIRQVVARSIGPKEPATGGLWRMLRRSPLVGADLDISRPFESGREADL